jgi:formylglycine-generating enzyme required for sulfatase activity
MSCCVPGSDATAGDPVHGDSLDGARAPRLRVMERLPGGVFAMGDDGPLSYPSDLEGPVRTVAVEGFEIDPLAVTTAAFAEFVGATGYVTDAERHGWSFVFAGLLPDDFPETRGVAAAPWWRQVPGASWGHPQGPGSDISELGTHPVVHVSWNDALAFARWHDARLPSEAEWEYAARAGSATTFPWGEELEPQGRHMANVWQGSFPDRNTCDDGWYATCPVDAFAANAFGLFNLIGNVWEWTLDGFSRPVDGEVDDPSPRALKGGSFLCHASYCHRYRPGARSSAAADSSASNVGFRCARS